MLEAAPPEQPDQDILELLQQGGQAAAFQHLVERYENKMLRLALSMRTRLSSIQYDGR